MRSMVEGAPCTARKALRENDKGAPCTGASFLLRAILCPSRRYAFCIVCFLLLYFLLIKHLFEGGIHNEGTK